LREKSQILLIQQLHNEESFMDKLLQEYRIQIQEGKNEKLQTKIEKVDKFINLIL
jgi:hypothetical protein